ncbi:hypothetical protein AQUCO_01500402v1 [Aquilegia coerulea]|uniref:Uncharacterized protein n=1 Tax=Aquilegia coerulea TaxID=218851 RepID=A0A2G5DTH6_AQUCA|nr:hypothetical protein AQUCO_01500402v1 [Aquilegia coerulea]PIA46835.1 hypothetical protein AQUCO_01500402v1 [Aquilegia coerulea]
MSMLRTPSTRKPPLAEQVNRIPPPRRVLRSNANSIPSTPVSATKIQIPNRRLSSVDASEVPSEFRSISTNLQALAKMVEDEFGNVVGSISTTTNTTSTMNIDPSVVYERGRFYEEYSARRNERLKRKKGVTGQEKKSTPYSLGVTFESGKKRESKKLDSLRKSVPANFSVSQTTENTPRYSLRSSTKENKKPPLPLDVEKSVVGTRRTRRI